MSCYSGGIPEAVADGETGFLVPERDVDSIADRIRTLLSDSDLWMAMSESARSYAVENYDIGSNTLHLEALYDGVSR